MDIQRFTERAQEALVNAQRDAEARNHQQVEPEHVLGILLKATDSVPSEVIRKLGGQPQSLAGELEHELEKVPKVFGGQLYLSQRLRGLISNAEREAER